MIRCRSISGLILFFATLTCKQSFAVLLLYEPFDYAESNFLSATTVGTPNSTTSPIGYLAPNFNNWYGTAIDAGGYQVANDSQVINADLTIPGLAKPSATTKALNLGGTGYSYRLSLNTSTQVSPNRPGPNPTDNADAFAGTDPTLQATDTGHSGYYSIALRVVDITGLNANGGVLLGFNNLTGGQTFNPTTVAAALTIRPKSGGTPGQFQLGVVKNGATNFTSATWDSTTYTTNTTLFVVGKYQTVGDLYGGPPVQTDDVASLWINPSSTTFGGYDPTGNITSTAGDDITTSVTTNNHTLQSFVLRQNGTAANNQIPVSIVYDELRVGTSWADVTPGLQGDYNGNGIVDVADYVLWRNGGPLSNEVDTRGLVNAADFNQWQSRFGNSNGSGVGVGAAVPEPLTVWLLACATISLRLRRNRR